MKKDLNNDIQFIRWQRDLAEYALKSLAERLFKSGFCPMEFCEKEEDCPTCVFDRYMAKAKEEIIPF